MIHPTAFDGANDARHCMADRDGRKPSARRGLLIHAGALGDFILSLRMVNTMHMWGMPAVSVLGRGSAAALAGFAGIRHVLDLDTGGFHALFSRAPSPARSAVRAALQGFDLTINMLGGSGSGLCAERLQDLTGGVVIDIDPRPQAGCTDHITDQWLEQIRRGSSSLSRSDLRHDARSDDAPAERKRRLRRFSDPDARRGLALVGPPHLHVSKSSRRQARRRLEAICPSTRRLAIVHPGSGGRRKCWPLDCNGQFAQTLQIEGWGIIGLLGPVELDTWAPAQIESLRRIMPLIADAELANVPTLLSAADLYVGNDSGVTHVAAAVGTPTVAVFGPTDPRIWRPLGPRVRVVSPLDREKWPSAVEVAAAARLVLVATDGTGRYDALQRARDPGG